MLKEDYAEKTGHCVVVRTSMLQNHRVRFDGADMKEMQYRIGC